LYGNIKASTVERLKHDLGSILAILRRIKGLVTCVSVTSELLALLEDIPVRSGESNGLLAQPEDT